MRTKVSFRMPQSATLLGWLSQAESKPRPASVETRRKSRNQNPGVKPPVELLSRPESCLFYFCLEILAGIRTPAKKDLVCLVSGRQREPKKNKNAKWERILRKKCQVVVSPGFRWVRLEKWMALGICFAQVAECEGMAPCQPVSVSSSDLWRSHRAMEQNHAHSGKTPRSLMNGQRAPSSVCLFPLARG